jgi:hypothetical protein
VATCWSMRPAAANRSPAHGREPDFQDLFWLRPFWRSGHYAEISDAKDPAPGIEFVSLSESLDTATPAGRMVFAVQLRLLRVPVDWRSAPR